ncbi:MAG: hypothetical protein ABMA26_00330 [Limisphaerales bacterium]
MNDLLRPAPPSRSSLAICSLAFVIGLLCAVAPQRVAAVVVPAVVARQSVDAEFKALLALEEDARKDMSRWLAETAARDEHLAGKPHNSLSLRMEHRFQRMCAAYSDFRSRHPEHGVAKHSEEAFREDTTDDLEAIRRWEEARVEDPASPAPWNDLAHHLSHNGRTTEAFACFEKSLSLAPREAVYFFDFATTLLLYRSDAARHYELNEQAVFEKVLTLYRRGMKLEPASYMRAASYAETFYLIAPARREEGLAAWHHAYSLATDDTDRDDARVHLARYALSAHHPNLARCYLEQVEDPRLEPVKEALLRRVNEASKPEKAGPVPSSSPAAK